MKGEQSSCLPGTLIGERGSVAESGIRTNKNETARASPISSQINESALSLSACSFADNH